MEENGFWWGFFVCAGLSSVLLYYDGYWDEPELEPVATAKLQPFRQKNDAYVTTTKTGTIWRVDSDTVRRNGNKRQGWLIHDHSKDNNTPYRKTMELWQVNCETTEYTTPETVAYNREGGSINLEPSKRSSFAVPGSNAKAVVNVICSNRYETNIP